MVDAINSYLKLRIRAVCWEICNLKSECFYISIPEIFKLAFKPGFWVQNNCWNLVCAVKFKKGYLVIKKLVLNASIKAFCLQMMLCENSKNPFRDRKYRDAQNLTTCFILYKFSINCNWSIQSPLFEDFWSSCFYDCGLINILNIQCI